MVICTHKQNIQTGVGDYFSFEVLVIKLQVSVNKQPLKTKWCFLEKCWKCSHAMTHFSAMNGPSHPSLLLKHQTVTSFQRSCHTRERIHTCVEKSLVEHRNLENVVGFRKRKTLLISSLMRWFWEKQYGCFSTVRPGWL